MTIKAAMVLLSTQAQSHSKKHSFSFHIFDFKMGHYVECSVTVTRDASLLAGGTAVHGRQLGCLPSQAASGP